MTISEKTTTKAASKATAKVSNPRVVDLPHHGSLAAALAAFQGECPPIRKGNTAKVATKAGGSYSYDYADLTDVIEVVEPVLSRHGLSFSGKPTVTKHGFGLVYKLRHTSGEVDKGFYPLPDPTRTPQQEMGSALTYIRRYVLCAVVGVAPGGDDDDAQTAQQYAQRQRQAPQGQARPAQRAPQAPRQAARQPERDTVDYVAQAEAAATPQGLSDTWQEARAAGAPTDVLDAIAAVGRRRQAEAQAQLEPQVQAQAGEPEPEDAEAAAIAAHEAELAAQAEAVQA